MTATDVLSNHPAQTGGGGGATWPTLARRPSAPSSATLVLCRRHRRAALPPRPCPPLLVRPSPSLDCQDSVLGKYSRQEMKVTVANVAVAAAADILFDDGKQGREVPRILGPFP